MLEAFMCDRFAHVFCYNELLEETFVCSLF